MNNNFNLTLANTTEQTKVNGKTFDTWKRSYVDEKGQVHEIVLRETRAVLNATRIDALLSMKEFSLLGLCYELSVCEPKDYGFKRIGEVAEHYFHIKSGTANGYARVGKHFVIKSDDDKKGTSYRLIEAVEGSTVTNLVQCLSLVNEDDENPLDEFYKAVLPDDNGNVAVNLNATLAELKKQLKAYKNGTTPDGVIADVEAKEVSSEKVEAKADFTTILEAIERIQEVEKKTRALELVGELQSLLA